MLLKFRSPSELHGLATATQHVVVTDHIAALPLATAYWVGAKGDILAGGSTLILI